jgi:hypothetical protein
MIIAMRALIAVLPLASLAACGPADPPVRPAGGGATSDPLPGDGEATPVGVDPGDPAPAGGAAQGGLPRDAQVMLDEHNRYRANHCAGPLTWSDELAAVAQRWADQLRDAGCAFEHSQTQYGENLAAGSSGALPPEAVVEMWYREVDKYEFPNGGFSMETGHFTQLVWTDTTKLGCGMSQCNGFDVWVCNYDPPGNYEGQYRQKVLPVSCQ